MNRITYKQADYMIDTKVQGIPCIIAIYGTRYATCEWQVLDRRQYPAPWLARKMTSKDERIVWEEVAEWLQSEYR
jgi:hypothetical protein